MIISINFTNRFSAVDTLHLLQRLNRASTGTGALLYVCERAFGPNFRPKMALRTLLGTNKLFGYGRIDSRRPDPFHWVCLTRNRVYAYLSRTYLDELTFPSSPPPDSSGRTGSRRFGREAGKIGDFRLQPYYTRDEKGKP